MADERKVLAHSAEQIDEAVEKVLDGTVATKTDLQKKADTSSVYRKDESISASTRTALSLPETATPDAALAEIARQLSGTVESTDYPGCYYRTVDGVTEWVNPPMQIGVEYRTTERYQGKPVYVKVVDFGALPNSSTAEVNHNISDIDYLVSSTGIAKRASDGWTFMFPSSPSLPPVSTMNVSKLNIRAVTSVDWSGFNLYVTMKYTKTTD